MLKILRLFDQLNFKSIVVFSSNCNFVLQNRSQGFFLSLLEKNFYFFETWRRFRRFRICKYVLRALTLKPYPCPY